MEKRRWKFSSSPLSDSPLLRGPLSREYLTLKKPRKFWDQSMLSSNGGSPLTALTGRRGPTVVSKKQSQLYFKSCAIKFTISLASDANLREALDKALAAMPNNEQNDGYEPRSG